MWHVFGNNGFFDNPDGLITESLLRRRATPGRQVKCISQREQIVRIDSAHFCHLRERRTIVDANKRPLRPHGSGPYDGITDVAHINHYMCRSFVNWMSRVKRGDTAFSRSEHGHIPRQRWRFDETACLRKFVNLGKDTNECVDLFMTQFSDRLKAGLAALKETEVDGLK
jgi:hypothetical protein